MTKLAVILFVTGLLLAARASAAVNEMHRAGAGGWHRVLARHHVSRAKLLRHRVIRLALRLRGVPYVWGGSSTGGFDCSGLVQYVYRHVTGRWLPRTTWAQMRVGRRVSASRLMLGDAVYLNGGSHTGLYLGHGLIVDAPHTGSVVRIDSLRWYRFTTARRFIGR